MEKHPHSKTVLIMLWTSQIILSVCFIWGASMKLFLSIKELSMMWPWTGEVPVALVKGTGIIDLLAGIGIIIPSFIQKPKLVWLTSIGTIALMFSASIFHICRGEASQIGINVFLAILAAFVVWGEKIIKKKPHRISMRLFCCGYN
ncbi:DoxX family protein [Flavobacterium sp. ANB]|uniref:DoxX family protein n=1 Tax=unclassified Flavobacterium TaxID=196869 RepID=UPI0012B787B2|nr:MULTISPECIES: DoxX family protein [unclassified Flavobacterium]MBF4518679.1 DoxX family protein [Flavobacterium sp. ANB]MTD67815.1 DoxX family protein [Flavobacterium sp. LC2016-13]